MASLIIHVLSVDTPLTKPRLTVFPPSSKNGHVTLVCLAEKYFPDVIKIEWKKNNEIVSEAKAQLEKDKAAIVLKVTDNEDFVKDRYLCRVTHEALPNGHYEEELPKIKAQPGKKATGPTIAPTCPPGQYTNDEKKDTISLSPFNVGTFAYTFLILKSAMYFGIISVLTYKIKSAQALGVKKRVP
ncbi:hypothetical protein AOXY_G4682 [Acipenser oxyrinchus oxyrinchus]|uniref:Ig-like domain-containing protein n=1 Tax=Acipenser oxyrinchus oxyrinchus TaxID=40147 RepID=A0AAD8GDG3_ACIOX|nr:hypothetical protein AOXY_G4682 [Acipenser oxyrinchus oxyrinchus]